MPSQNPTEAATSETAASRPPAPAWARLLATFLGIGYLKPGPGTWASLATMLLWAWLGQFLAPWHRLTAAALIAVAVALAGIPAATLVTRASGRRDPGHVVIDEVAGQMIAMIAVPLRWQPLLASLILFRAFDIVKPPPLRDLEKLPGGTGIVLDDVAAGLYALMIMQILLRLGVL